MDSSTGRIFPDLKDLLMAEKLSQEDVKKDPKRFVQFANKERIEWKGCLFEIKEIRPDPINEIILKGLPALIGIEDITKAGAKKGVKMEKKYFWCPRCNAYPTEVFSYWHETRKWINNGYELVDTKGGVKEVLCGNCRTICEEKEED